MSYGDNIAKGRGVINKFRPADGKPAKPARVVKKDKNVGGGGFDLGTFDIQKGVDKDKK